MFDWDDMRIFLAAARARSFGSAADRLTIDTATVARRVARRRLTASRDAGKLGGQRTGSRPTAN